MPNRYSFGEIHLDVNRTVRETRLSLYRTRPSASPYLAISGAVGIAGASKSVKAWRIDGPR